MGLAIGKARWAYGGFMQFRRALARAEGFDLSQMIGFRNDFEPRQEPGLRDWRSVDTNLRPLLYHSDCDGEMTWVECARVEPRLSEILDNWSSGHIPSGLDGYHEFYLEEGRLLAEAMRECVATRTELRFR